jgi:hypothetical protein
MTIRIQINQLVLDGTPVQRQEAPVIVRAVEKELTRLLSEGGLSQNLASGGEYPEIRAGRMKITSNNPREIGKEIAQAVYGGIGR